MASGERRGVTRGYVVGLIGAVTILSLALLVAAWGGVSLARDTAPIQTEYVPFVFAPLSILLLVAILIGLLWSEAIALLSGKRTPPLGQMVIAGCGAYLVWSVGGTVVGLTVAETWLSPYAALLGLIWLLAPLGFWAVLTRRIYTDRPPPRWPWERHPAPGDLQYPDYPVDPESGSQER